MIYFCKEYLIVQRQYFRKGKITMSLSTDKKRLVFVERGEVNKNMGSKSLGILSKL